MSYFADRRIRRQARDVAHHARHLRNMRGDLMTRAEHERLDKAEAALAQALKSKDMAAAAKTTERLYEGLQALSPRRSFPWMRENLEVLVVAIAVAMGFRTYCLQPFKIPTGSMQPTLYGIHVRPADGPTLLDQMPLKMVKWFFTGDWYSEVRAKTSGQWVRPPGPLIPERRDDEYIYVLSIGGYRHELPTLEGLRIRDGDYVTKGQLIWSGIRTAGDHVLVDKVRWNFTSPRRGNVIVFTTRRIPSLPQNTFYIKRLAGLPGETLSIRYPNLVINGEPVTTPRGIQRVSNREPGYSGYVPALSDPGAVINSDGASKSLGAAEYFALGDNTRNSKDSRYWGPVPQANMVGPAALVYWPIINTHPGPRRWGLIQ